MLVTYDTKKCNLKSCSLQQEKNLLCKKHYNLYITDSRIEERIQRLTRLISGHGNIKDKFKYYRNFAFHSVTGIHVPYIEHFPLETIFLYYESDFLSKDQKDCIISTEQFVSNFDFEENVYISRLKVLNETSKFYEPFKKFSNSHVKRNKIFLFAILWIFLFVSFKIFKYNKIDIPYSNFWYGTIIVFFLGLTVLISGIKFTNSTKKIIKEAASNKLLVSPEENKIFLKKAHPWLSFIKSSEENLWGLYGILSVVSSFAVFIGYRKIEIANTLQYSTYFFYSVIVTIMVYILLKIVWNNRYLIKLIRRIPNDTIKFNLYEKKRTAGVDNLMNFFRSLTVYNIAVVITLNLSYVNLKATGIDIDFFYVIILSFFFSWNYSSFFIIAYKFQQIKKSFMLHKSNELNRLKGLNSAASIIKFQFLDPLQLRFISIVKPFMGLLSILLYVFNILASYLISKYENEMDNLFTKLVDLLKNGFLQ